MVKKFQQPVHGRSSLSNPDQRFQQWQRESFDDGWGSLEATVEKIKTELFIDNSKTVISYNQSPDIPFDRSINPYRGCEHGCVYCFARPSHAWLGLSPGLDFESKIFYKPDAASLLAKEINKPGYECAPIALGINTDAYQPAERQLGITRQILEVLQHHKHPVSIVTKSALIERDLDILEAMAGENLVHIAVSMTTLDKSLSRTMEPRASSPRRRLQTIETLRRHHIPVGSLIAPLIPVLTDAEMETILKAVHDAGARFSGYVMLRMPHELKQLFREWLVQHYPDKAEHIIHRIQDLHGGQDYRPEFGQRMRGSGVFAELINKRFKLAYERLDFPGISSLDCSNFQKNNEQLSLL
jgi:DNA repair photolyase